MLRPWRLAGAAALMLAVTHAAAAQGNPEPQRGEDPRPLSAAQTALFSTPHLSNIARPETLEYRFTQLGPQGFTDRITVTVAAIHPDGTKDVRFDFLTGDRHVLYPGIADFAGNPLLMLFLEHDVRQMREQTGIAAAYFRERIRQAFVDRATVAEGQAEAAGRRVAARTIVIAPYADDARFGHVKVIQQKTYTFVLSADVPGQIATLRADAPADPSIGAPALGNTIDFTGERS